jgi:large subunit ribosomal protein L10
LAVSKDKKSKQLQELRGLMESSQAVIVLDYRGLTAMNMVDLRGKLRPLNSKVMVAKNTLVLRSLGELGMPQPEELLQGPSLYAFCQGEIADAVRAFTSFAREHEPLKIKGAVVGHSVLDARAATALRDLPSTQALRGQVVGSLQAPAAGLVNLLDAALSGIVYALRAHAEQLEKTVA